LAGVVAALLAGCGSSTPDKPTPDAADPGPQPCTTEQDCATPTPYCEPSTGTCAECRFDTHCPEGICEAQSCRAPHSCKELHEAQPGLATGTYSIDTDGSGAAPAIDVFCDMSTDGGGWMALLSPESATAAMHPDLVATTAVISGTQTCEASTVPADFVANGWHGLRSYACGVVTFSMTLGWVNTIGATDVMFIATLQGETTRTLTVNGTSISPNATGTDAGGATCVFYNAPGTSASPATNGCYTTYLDVAPVELTSAFTGDLSLVISTGPACAPSCSHGTGMNIQKVFVR
jgi:hypothetical protein